MENTKAIQALVQLLDDPDDAIYSHVKNKLIEYGTAAIEILESTWEENTISTLHQYRIEKIIHDIQFNETKKSIYSWFTNDNKNLIEGWFILSKWHYPGLSIDSVLKKIEEIKKDVWIEINDDQTAYEKVKILNKVIFQRYHFQGDNKNYHSPINSFINTVLETKHGNPLSLSIIYSHIAQLLNIPIYGVNLPNHFILAYLDENKINGFLGNETHTGVLFYINAFSNGVILYEEDIKKFLKQLQLEENHSYFEPCKNSTIIARIITNLIASYQQIGNAQKVEELVELKKIITQ
jgi:regulator of sirC expression with transglutaminase-like and TPR domain